MKNKSTVIAALFSICVVLILSVAATSWQGVSVDVSGNLGAPLGMFSANILPGTNVVFQTNATTGKITISSTASGTTSGLDGSVTNQWKIDATNAANTVMARTNPVTQSQLGNASNVVARAVIGSTNTPGGIPSSSINGGVGISAATASGIAVAVAATNGSAFTGTLAVTNLVVSQMTLTTNSVYVTGADAQNGIYTYNGSDSLTNDATHRISGVEDTGYSWSYYIANVWTAGSADPDLFNPLSEWDNGVDVMDIHVTQTTNTAVVAGFGFDGTSISARVPIVVTNLTAAGTFSGTNSGDGTGLTGVNGIYNFANYASTDDGVTDVSGDVQALLDSVPWNASVYIPKSTSANAYWVWGHTVIIPKAIQLYGDDVIPGEPDKETIMFTGSGPALKVTNIVSGLRISRLAIQGTDTDGQVGFQSTDALNMDCSFDCVHLMHFDRAMILTNFGMQMNNTHGFYCRQGILNVTTLGNTYLPLIQNSGTGRSTSSNGLELVNSGALVLASDSNSTNAVAMVQNCNPAWFINCNAEVAQRAGIFITNSPDNGATRVGIVGGRFSCPAPPVESRTNCHISIYGPVNWNHMPVSYDPTWDGYYGYGLTGQYLVTNYSGTAVVGALTNADGTYVRAHPIGMFRTEVGSSGTLAGWQSASNRFDWWGDRYVTYRSGATHDWEYILTNVVSEDYGAGKRLAPRFAPYDHYQYFYDRYAGSGTNVLKTTNAPSAGQVLKFDGTNMFWATP